MEAAIKTVVSVFLKSSKGKENLGGKEFQSLVKSQLKNILTGTEDNEAVKNMRQQLDNNEDGKVSFQEYMNLIGYLDAFLNTFQNSPYQRSAWHFVNFISKMH
uniref:S100 calcium binding protein U n=2 Tax=Cyprinus carpio TaxID=7962 RepID=A0A8C2JSM4_CYPCA